MKHSPIILCLFLMTGCANTMQIQPDPRDAAWEAGRKFGQEQCAFISDGNRSTGKPCTFERPQYIDRMSDGDSVTCRDGSLSYAVEAHRQDGLLEELEKWEIRCNDALADSINHPADTSLEFRAIMFCARYNSELLEKIKKEVTK